MVETCLVVHPDSIDDVYLTPDPGDCVNGAFTSQFGSTDGTGGLLQTTQQKPAADAGAQWQGGSWRKV